jgi:hypothetical protein
MWDDQIRARVDPEEHFATSKYGYVRYLIWAKRQIDTALEEKGITTEDEAIVRISGYLHLEPRMKAHGRKKHPAKLVDECFWWIADHRRQTA